MKYSIQSGKTVEEAVQKALDDLRISRDQAKIEVIEEASKGFLGLIGGKEAIVKVAEIVETKDILDSIFDTPSFDTKKEANKRDIPSEEKLENKPVEKELIVEDKPEAAPQEDQVAPAQTSTEGTLEEDPVDQNLDQDKPLDIEEVEEVEDISQEEKNSIIKDYIAKVMESFGIAYTLEIQHKDNMILVSIDGKKEETGIIIGKRGATLDSIQYILSLILNSKTQVFNRVILDCSNYREKRQATLENLAHKMAKKALNTNRSVRLEPMNAQERRIIHAALGSVEGVTTHSEGKDPYRRVVIQKERKY